MNKVIASDHDLLLRSASISPVSPLSPNETELNELAQTVKNYYQLGHLSHEQVQAYMRDVSFRYVLLFFIVPHANTKDFFRHAKVIGLMTTEGELVLKTPDGMDDKLWKILHKKSETYALPLPAKALSIAPDPGKPILFTFSSTPHAIGVKLDPPVAPAPPHPNAPKIQTVISFLDRPLSEILSLSPHELDSIFSTFLSAAQKIGLLGDHCAVSSFKLFEQSSGIPYPQWEKMLSKWGAIYTGILARNSVQLKSKPHLLVEHLQRFLTGYNFTSLRNGIGLHAGDDIRILRQALDTIRHFGPQLGQDVISLLEKYCENAFATEVPAVMHAIESATGPGYTSKPSAGHSNDNQDRVVVGNLTIPNGVFAVVCDGISNCGTDSSGKTITGRSAAINVSQAFEGFLKNFPFRKQFPSGFNPTNKDHLSQLQNRVNSFLKKTILLYMDKEESATTLEIALEIPFEGHPYLVTLTLGDSQTMVRDAGGTFHMMNVCQNRSGFRGNELVNLDDADVFLEHPIDLVRDIRDPGGSITMIKSLLGQPESEFYHHTMGNESCAVSVKRLDPGSTYFVYSDGYGDMCTVSLHESVDYNDLPRLHGITQAILDLKLPDSQTAEVLSAIAILVSGKVDDVTLFVKTVVAIHEV